LARDLLQSVRALDVPEQAQARVWDAVAASIALGAASTTLAAASGVAAASAGVGVGSKLAGAAIAHAGIIAKLGVVLVIGSASAGTTYWLQQRDQRIEQTRRHALTATPRPTVLAPTPQPVIELTPTEPQQPTGLQARKQGVAKAPVKSKDHKGVTRVDADLALENQLVQRVREHLRAGEKRAAHAKMRELRERVPRGVLMQERTILWIELERMRGKRDSAKRAAQAFVREHPESLHTPKLQQFLAEP
jgi:hypothetical protein